MGTPGDSLSMRVAPKVVTNTGHTPVVHESRQQRNPEFRLDVSTHKREFIALSEEEQILLYGKLLAKCHSSSCLQAQGYRLTVAPPENKPGKERPPKEKSAKDQDAGQALRQEKRPEEISAQRKSPQDKPSDDKDSKDLLSKFSQNKKRQPIYFTRTPTFVSRKPDETRRAVALDCEMVAVMGGDDEVAFLSAVDFFTGEILIHSYVQPTRRVIQWRSNVSGIEPAAMAAAVAAGQALRGWRFARQALWKYAGPDTVLIGHCLRYDLNVLRIIHPKIVDSAILSAEAVFNEEPLKRVWALKRVAKEFLNRDIQRGKKGHDSLEDTYAARDVVIWCLRNPDRLSAWGKNAREKHELKMEQVGRSMKLENGRRRRKKNRRSRRRQSRE